MKSLCTGLLLAAPVFAQADAAISDAIVHRALGVRFAPRTATAALQPGLRIVAVADRSPAAELGLLPGDVLIRFDGTIVDDAGAVAAGVRELDLDDRVELAWFHRGERGWTELSGAARIHLDAKTVVRDTFGVEFAVLESRLRRRIVRTESPWGFKIARVVDGSVADGLGLGRGDILMQWDGQPVRRVDQLARWLFAAEPGAKVRIEVARRKKAVGILSRDPWESLELEVTMPGAPR